jgi:asparagine synthase (glutamine-hydrolysing)
MEWFLDGDLSDWDCLSRAQYVEVAIFLSGYLLSSQGDRVAMAHSVEGRFPFLDHNVVEFCSLIPPKYKLNGLNEKYILKKCWEKEIPASILKRPKQPYRAPDSACFLGARRPELVETLLSEKELARTGIFNARDVARLLKRIENSNGRPASARDDMAVAGILSTQLLHHHFIDELPSRISQAREAAGRLNVRVDERVSETAPIGGR